MLLSVILPCYNEEQIIAETYHRLTRILQSLDDIDYELIFVDDGSEDNTFSILTGYQQNDSRVRILKLSRNFGQQMATTAGMAHASGDAIILMDADLQDPPEMIPSMISEWKKGFDVVYGERMERPGEGLLKRVTSRAFYRIIRRLSDVKIPQDTGDFRLMDRTVVHAFLTLRERDRFVRGLVSWLGFRQTGLSFRRPPRQAGETKYPFTKSLKLAADAMVSFSSRPLKLATWLGFSASGVALAGIVYALVLRLLTDIWVTGWTALFIAVLFMGGVQLICLGIIGEYIGRIYGETKCRPLYLIQKKLGFSNGDPYPAFNRTIEE
jgi:dolichol-phosphate mannosyltransferase